jgi:hypothetical protein
MGLSVYMALSVTKKAYEESRFLFKDFQVKINKGSVKIIDANMKNFNE